MVPNRAEIITPSRSNKKEKGLSKDPLIQGKGQMGHNPGLWACLDPLRCDMGNGQDG